MNPILSLFLMIAISLILGVVVEILRTLDGIAKAIRKLEKP